MSKRPGAAVISGSRELVGFGRGVQKMAALVRPTHGPTPRVVANAGALGSAKPELLDSGGIIARRMVQLDDRVEDVGAMFLRGILWGILESVGDGVTTAAIVFQAVFEGGVKAITSGMNPARLRHYLLAYSKVILDELSRQTIPVRDESQLVRIAQAVCGEQQMARHFGELAAALGEHGRIEVRAGQARSLSTSYMEGPFWETASLDSAMVQGQIGLRGELESCALFVSDLDLSDPAEMVAILTAAKERAASSLIIVARSLSKPCLGVAMANNTPGFRVFAVRNPGLTPEDRLTALEDMALLVAARVFRTAAGDSARAVKREDLGMSRRAWITRTHFGIVGPTGNGRMIRDKVRSLREQFADTTDEDRRKQLSLRISRLTSMSAILWVDGTTGPAMDRRKELAQRTSRAVQRSMSHGTVPGGGAALLACARKLQCPKDPESELEARATLRILAKALEAPSRVLAANSGFEAATAVAEAHRSGDGFGLDVTSGVVVDMASQGVLDSSDVVAIAIRKAIEGAAQALSIDTIVLHRSPQIANSP